VFNRVPILAMRGALPGMPLRDGHSIEWFDSHRALGDGVAALIEDFDTLNLRHERAFKACTGRFDWSSIGQLLFSRMKAA